MSPARAQRLRTELADEQNRWETVSAGADRISSKLQSGGRLDPEDTADHDDVAHHYEATLRPALADLDPSQKAIVIRGYVANTGIAPEAAVKSLLGLAVAGDPTNRIVATRPLKEGFIELRGRNGGRVILKRTDAGDFDIVGEFEGHRRGDKENSNIIETFIKNYKSGKVAD